MSTNDAFALLITWTPEQFPHHPPRPDLVEELVENGIRGFLKTRR